MAATKKRHPRHDDLVALILTQREVLQRFALDLAGIHKITSITTEYECQELLAGYHPRWSCVGWIDVLVGGLVSRVEKFPYGLCKNCGDIQIHESEEGFTCEDKRSTYDREEFLIIEVKSELEKWTAGDVVRQLKRYSKTFRSKGDEHTLAFLCDRELSAGERAILIHEGVHILW